MKEIIKEKEIIHQFGTIHKFHTKESTIKDIREIKGEDNREKKIYQIFNHKKTLF